MLVNNNVVSNNGFFSDRAFALVEAHASDRPRDTRDFRKAPLQDDLLGVRDPKAQHRAFPLLLQEDRHEVLQYVRPKRAF